jgi:hypothetical protein
MAAELSGRRIVVPETRELGQWIRMLEERRAEAVPCAGSRRHSHGCVEEMDKTLTLLMV